MKNKYYIVGSGLVGSVIAHELALTGAKVKLFEKKDHVGGNLFDFTDEHGIRVQLYGPHIFHTNNHDIYEYVSNLCTLTDYKLVCGAVIDGICVPTAFDYTAIDTFFPNESNEIKEHIKLEFGYQKSATVLEMLDSTDAFVKKFADFLYEKDYKPYTAKQWGISPEEVDKQIFKRVPIKFSYSNSYFEDKFQAIPQNGYMELINNLLNNENITIEKNIDALKIISIRDREIYLNNEPIDGTLIYTGPIDELFDNQFGHLKYRSLRFEWKHEKIDSFQDMAVVAYPQSKDFTRITEYKKLPTQIVNGTTYAIEYPMHYNQEENDPYYPVVTDETKVLFNRYQDMALEVTGLICCGRLADYKYYNMDQAIERALEVVSLIKLGVGNE